MKVKVAIASFSGPGRIVLGASFGGDFRTQAR